MDPIDFIFSSYVGYLKRNGIQPDSVTRSPASFSTIWAEKKIVPKSETLVLVTGSKGKGTVSRHIAWNLQTRHKVGLVVSPEELGHYDRIRINNRPIDQRTFDLHMKALMPWFINAGNALSGDKCLSPTGYFMTVALSWFAEEQVDYVVIEGGRGVIHDEVGQLDAALGVITSIFDEHQFFLGGSFEHVIQDKLAMARRCGNTVISQQVLDLCMKMDLPLPVGAVFDRPALADAKFGTVPDVPVWLIKSRIVSWQALNFLRHPAEFKIFASPSRIEATVGNTRIICEPVIHHDSLDPGFLRSIAGLKAAVVMGLSDQKPIQDIVSILHSAGLHDLYGFDVYSPVGHVSSMWLRRFGEQVKDLGKLDCVTPDVAGCRKALSALCQGKDVIYMIGIQIFIRTVRLALDMQLEGPA